MTPDPITAAKFWSGLVNPRTAVKSIAFGLWLIVFVFAGFMIWKTFFTKTESYHQQAQQITNIEVYNPEDNFFLGVRLWGFKLGISHPTVKKMAEITEEAQEIKK